MLQYQCFIIKSRERGLLYRDEQLVRHLEPGTHWFFDPNHELTLELARQQRESRATGGQSLETGAAVLRVSL